MEINIDYAIDLQIAHILLTVGNSPELWDKIKDLALDCYKQGQADSKEGLSNENRNN